MVDPYYDEEQTKGLPILNSVNAAFVLLIQREFFITNFNPDKEKVFAYIYAKASKHPMIALLIVGVYLVSKCSSLKM